LQEAVAASGRPVKNERLRNPAVPVHTCDSGSRRGWDSRRNYVSE
jgi:hypothetical protein